MGERELMRAYRAATEPGPERAGRLRPRPPRGWGRGLIAGMLGAAMVGALVFGSNVLHRELPPPVPDAPPSTRVASGAVRLPPESTTGVAPLSDPPAEEREAPTRLVPSSPQGEGPPRRPGASTDSPRLPPALPMPVAAPDPAPSALPVPVAAPDPAPSALPTPVALPAGRSAPVPGAVTLADGIGRVDAADPLSLTWIVGTLDVTTAPGLTVRVSTDDAVVTGRGADLRVHRDALGTDVIARSAGVTVTCGAVPPVPLPVGAHQLCLPTTAAGWLGRAQALEGHAPADEVVAAVDAGLAHDAPPAVRAELETVRLRGLVAAGHSAEALDAVRAYLAEGHPERRDEVRQIGVALADRAGACDEARVWAEGAADPALSRCRR